MNIGTTLNGLSSIISYWIQNEEGILKGLKKTIFTFLSIFIVYAPTLVSAEPTIYRYTGQLNSVDTDVAIFSESDTFDLALKINSATPILKTDHYISYNVDQFHLKIHSSTGFGTLEWIGDGQGPVIIFNDGDESTPSFNDSVGFSIFYSPESYPNLIITEPSLNSLKFKSLVIVLQDSSQNAFSDLQELPASTPDPVNFPDSALLQFRLSHEGSGIAYTINGQLELPSILDNDGDSVPDDSDLCPASGGAPVDVYGCTDAQVDTDGDGYCNANAASTGPSGCIPTDNCPTVYNPDQVDDNADGFGDACVSPDLLLDKDTTIGDNVVIEEGVSLSKETTIGSDTTIGQNVAVGKDTSIGEDTEIGENTSMSKDTSIGSSVTVGSGVSIAKGVVIGTDVYIGDNTTIKKDSTIGNNVWIGSGVNIGIGVQVLNNATIEDNTVIPSGEVVSP